MKTKILILNLGSSSIKYQLIDIDREFVLAKGLIEKIGFDKGIATFNNFYGKTIKEFKKILTHEQGIKILLNSLVNKTNGVIKKISEINAIGHRIVQGGNYFKSSVIINSDIKKKIKECFQLAPLHNPPQYKGILAIEKNIPNTPNVASFDTVFHQTLPEEAYTYAIPNNWSKKYKIRKYGFHGLSHEYVSKKSSNILKKEYNKLKIITCHLGNGSSIAAIKNGECIDTSMGFTPLQGLVMGTRCGDIDPAIIHYMVKNKNYTIEEVNTILNNESGVKGISGISSDFRDLEIKSDKNNKKATLALEVFYRSVIFYIGGYYGILNGLDVLIFTGGIGENSLKTRKTICERLSNLGIEIDLIKNKIKGKDMIISKETSKVKVIVIPTNEELMIARNVKQLLFK